MDRRQFVKNLELGTTSLSMGSLVTAPSCALSGDFPLKRNVEEGEDGQPSFIGDDIATAQTEYGKVRGYLLNHVYMFLGVFYRANMSGKDRPVSSQKPELWADVRPAVFYGNTAPQRTENRWSNNYGTFADHWNYWDVSEDCLYLSVWTPGIADGKERPVLVWLHGGGLTSGSGIEQDGYHGEDISREGDIVLCSINHRLGPIGFSDLPGVDGEAYKDSGNVGMLDIIAALRWVHDNTADLGRDPGNVTVMGQSGGGPKVCTVAVMLAAKSLIHRTVALSGSTVGTSDQMMTRKVREYTLREAEPTAPQLDKLQRMPWREYLDIADRACKKCWEDQGISTRRTFGPVADDRSIPAGALYSGESHSKSSTVPMIFCTTFHE